MSEGLLFATLATLLGKKGAARYGARRVTIGAVSLGLRSGERWVMATFTNGDVVLGAPGDFTVVQKTHVSKRGRSQRPTVGKPGPRA